MRAAPPRVRPPPRRASTASTASAASSPSTASTASLTAPAPPSFPGARVESVVEKANMAINKNTVPGDKSAFIPGGIRIGTPALTSRGFEEAHFDEARRARNSGAILRNSAQFCAIILRPLLPLQVAEFIHRGVQIAKEVNSSGIGKKLADFKAALNEKPHPAIEKLAADVAPFAAQFPCVGFDETTMKYKDV